MSFKLAAFDPSFKKFALLSLDNRVKIWDSVTGQIEQELVDPKNAIIPYSCLTWPQETRTTKSSKKAKKLESQIALGTDKGSIIVWDLLRAEIAYSLEASKDGHNITVNDIIFNPQQGTLFSTSEDRYICQWDLDKKLVIWKSKQNQEAIKKLALSPDSTILASAGSGIKLWDLSSKRTLKKFTGHNSPVSSLQFGPGGNYLISSSNDRFIYLWDCDAQSDNKNAVQAFSTDSNPLFIDFSSFINGEQFHLLALTESGKVNVWKYSPNKKKGKSKPQQPEGTITSNVTIINARFCSDTEVIVSHGDIVKPSFDRLTYTSDGEIIKEQELTAKTNTNGMFISPNQQKSKKGKTVATTVGAHDLASKVSDELMKDIEAPSDEAELTLQEKLEALGFGSNKKETKTPKADSMQAVLTQALHTNDNALLESCLGVVDPTVIRNTVQSLPTKYVLPFLKASVERFHSKPSRVELVTWIRAVLIYHTSYLMTLPDLTKALAALYAVVDSRLTTFPKLLKLSGRLDLLLSQISAPAPAPTEENKPFQVYEESSDEEESEEDEEDAIDEDEEDEDVMEDD